jgi:hypothetical protein
MLMNSCLSRRRCRRTREIGDKVVCAKLCVFTAGNNCRPFNANAYLRISAKNLINKSKHKLAHFDHWWLWNNNGGKKRELC